MSTSVTNVVSHFPSAENGFTTTLASTISSGATTVPLNSVAGYTNGEVVVFVVDPSDATKKQTFTGIVDTAGVQITSVVWTAGTNQAHAGGATVVDYATATHISMVTKGLLVEHNQNGTHADVTAESLAVSGATTLTGALTVKSYDGWVNTADTWTYASATTFTIAGVDRTSQFPVGTKIKLTQTTAKYFYVTGSAFGTDTTVTITGGSDYSLANAAITSPALSYDATPQGFPQWFNYTPTFTNLSGGTLNYSKFHINGRRCLLKWKYTLAGAGISGSVSFTTPVTIAAGTNGDSVMSQIQLNDITGNRYGGQCIFVTTTSLGLFATSNSVTGAFAALSSTVPFTWASGDIITFNTEVEI